MPKVECEVCGGTDFYKESGHYFCNECQTQTQEIQEHVFEEELVKFNVKSTRKIEKNRDKSENNITSWECYNIILCKLTDQLIELGADKKLKPIVRYLWMSYLEKLEIIKPGEDIPKLPAVNYRKDAEIIYGIKTSRKRRRSVSSRSGSEATLNTSVSLKRERSRKKRALAESQLEEIAQKSTQESTSLYNETLTSIKSSSDKSSPSVMYNQYVLKELRKKCGKTHLKRHSSNVSMKCHKIKHSNISYKHKVTLLTPTKLYCILYVGLMINKDDIQIGDLLRFINDGHISFNYYRNLFPDDFHHKNLNIRDNSVKRTLTNFSFRKNVAQMINFLNLHKYITKPDLPKLCRRFCKELNLPDDLTNYVVNIVNKTSPKLNFAKNSTIFPNYEGRIMSVILVVLKLLFGFDDVTEYEFSRYSQLCDEYITFPKMFNVVDWMKYLHYRSVIIDEYHFPTQYNNNQTTVDSDLYLQFTSTKPPQFDEDMQLNKYMSQYKQLLLKLKDLQQNFNVGLEFEPSLTQSYNYCRFLSKSESNKPYQHEILNYESSNHSMDYLLKPNSFLKLINKGKHVDTVHHGANQNWKMKRIENLYTENKQVMESDGTLVTVKMVAGKSDNVVADLKRHVVDDGTHENALNQFPVNNADAFEKNTRLTQQNQLVDFQARNNVKIREQYMQHYNPFEQYWINYTCYSDTISLDYFNEFYRCYPESFRLIFGECARILGQSILTFYFEFQYTEAYLIYCANYTPREKNLKKNIKGRKLLTIVNRAKKVW